MSEFPAVSQLIPHTEPMILIDRLVAWSPGRATCCLQVRAGAPFVEGGALETAFMLEHMAQSVAVCLGYEAYRGGRQTRTGMIVSCRGFEIHEPRVDVGVELTIEASRLRSNDSTSHFECVVRTTAPLPSASPSDSATIANATLTLFYGELPDR
jgi:predicted hotdog family 3-hydroxylacyl-ACP dehydratase